MILTNGDKIKLSENYKLLNKLLGKSYKGFQKTRCKFENDCFIWIISFAKESEYFTFLGLYKTDKTKPLLNLPI